MSSVPPQQPPGYTPQPPYGQQPYGQQPYGQPPYGQQPYAQPASTNGLAIAAIICGFLVGPLGLIFGLIALSQIRNSGGTQKGKGLAITGVVLGALSVLYLIIIIIAAVSNS